MSTDQIAQPLLKIVAGTGPGVNAGGVEGAPCLGPGMGPCTHTEHAMHMDSASGLGCCPLAGPGCGGPGCVTGAAVAPLIFLRLPTWVDWDRTYQLMACLGMHKDFFIVGRPIWAPEGPGP